MNPEPSPIPSADHHVVDGVAYSVTAATECTVTSDTGLNITVKAGTQGFLVGDGGTIHVEGNHYLTQCGGNFSPASSGGGGGQFDGHLDTDLVIGHGDGTATCLLRLGDPRHEGLIKDNVEGHRSIACSPDNNRTCQDLVDLINDPTYSDFDVTAELLVDSVLVPDGSGTLNFYSAGIVKLTAKTPGAAANAIEFTTSYAELPETPNPCFGSETVKLGSLNPGADAASPTSHTLSLNGKTVAGIDDTPTEGSPNIVTSGGVYAALRALPAPTPEPLGTTTTLKHGHVYTLAVAADTDLSALGVELNATAELWIDYTGGTLILPSWWWLDGMSSSEGDHDIPPWGQDMEANHRYVVVVRNDGRKTVANVQYEYPL